MGTKNEDFMVDCVISAGELNGDGYTFKDNHLRFIEVAKHNVKYSEFVEWVTSDERFRKEKELYSIAEKHLGDKARLRYDVCFFCTLAK